MTAGERKRDSDFKLVEAEPSNCADEDLPPGAIGLDTRLLTIESRVSLHGQRLGSLEHGESMRKGIVWLAALIAAAASFISTLVAIYASMK